MTPLWCRLGAIFMALAVMTGAFGAHALKGRLDSAMLEVYKTAVLYHMIHALGLFAVAWIAGQTHDGRASLAGGLLVAGIVLFSGSLYLLSVTGVKWLGAITPIGGLCFIVGWGFLAAVRFTR